MREGALQRIEACCRRELPEEMRAGVGDSRPDVVPLPVVGQQDGD